MDEEETCKQTKRKMWNGEKIHCMLCVCRNEEEAFKAVEYKEA